jgi:hypothetical protein
MKKTYSAPVFEDLGSFETLTKGARVGSSLDAEFPAGTAFGDLTFS